MGEQRRYVYGWAALTRLMQAGKSWSGHERNCCFLNLGDGRFADISMVSGLNFEDDGRSAAVVDWEGDGDLDLWLKNRTGPQLRLMINETPADQHFIAFRLSGTSCNRDAIGATVEVFANGKRFKRSNYAGDGYMAQSSRWIHFGLADISEIDRVVIHWPGGHSQELKGLQTNHRYAITEGSEEVEVIEPDAVQWRGSEGLESSPDGSMRILLRTPLPLPPTITEAVMTPSDDGARAYLINLWAQWCGPCLVELQHFAANYEELHAAGLRISAWSLDASADQSKAEQMFSTRIASRMTEPAFKARPADSALQETLAAIFDHVTATSEQLSLPTSLLVDAEGVLRMIYLGPVKPEVLLGDVQQQIYNPAKGSRRSLYPGRWYFRGRRNYSGLAHDLRQRGQPRDAVFYQALFEAESRLRQQ